MQNTFEQLNKSLDSLDIILKGEVSLSQIEKDIILEKLRKLYLTTYAISAVESSKDDILIQQANFDVQQGVNEDVELFMDLDDESYDNAAAIEEQKAAEAEKQRLEEEAKRKAEEERRIEAEIKAEEERIRMEAERKKAEEEQRRIAEEQRRLQEEEAKRKAEAERLRLEEERRRAAETQTNPIKDEDDLLQFRPQKEAEKPVQRSLNDLFTGNNEDHSISAQFQNAKVTDLTKAFAVNEKFTFIRELFNNRGEEFSAAISTLNQCQSLDEAFNCLENYKKKYFWDSTSTAYLSLCDLLRRKFM